MNSFALVDHLGWVLIHSLWQFAAIALVAGLVVWMLRRSTSTARYAVWVIAMGLAVSAPVVTWMALPVEQPVIAAVIPQTDDVAVAPMSTEPVTESPPLPSNITLASDSPPLNTDASEPPTIAAPPIFEAVPPPTWSETLTLLLHPWMAWIVAAWCMGVALCSLRPLLGWHTLWRLRTVGVAPVSDDIRAALRRVSDRLGLRQTVQVLQSTLAQVPVVVGYLRPVILLPVSLLTNMPPSQLESILAHELAHIRRHDFVVNLLQTLVETLFFYHPAVWWLSRQIRVEREHCCDDLVVAALGNRVEYGRALLAIEELRGERTLLALGVHDGSLLSRIRRIVGFRADRTVSSPWMNLVFVTCLLSTIGLVSVLGWTASAEQEPGSTGETVNDDEIDVAKTLEPPKPVVAEWSEGRSIEFVGITMNTAAAKEGWLPSGLPIGDVGYWKSTTVLHSGNTSASYTENGPHPEPDADAIDFLFRFRGLKAQSSLTFDMPTRGTSYAHWPVADPYELRVSAWKRPVQPPPGGKWTPPDGVVRVGLTDEPWGRYVKISPEGEVLDPIQPNELYASTYKLIDVQGSKAHDRISTGKAILIREPGAHIDPDDPDHRYVFEFRAIDTDGKEHWAIHWEGRGVERTKWVDSQYGLAQPLPAGKTLSHYEYRLRPFRHWITFENVSIEPGPQTDVKFSVKSWPAVPVPLKVTNADGGPAMMLAEKPDSFEVLRVGQSRMLTSVKNVKECRSFDPKMIDIRPIDPQTISITGVSAGLTVLTAINEADEIFQQLIEVTTEAAPPNAEVKPIAFRPRDKRLKSRLTLKERTPSIPVQIGVGHELEFPGPILSFESSNGKTATPRMHGNRILDILGGTPGKTTITVTTMDDEVTGAVHVWQIKAQVEQPTPLQLRKLFSTDEAPKDGAANDPGVLLERPVPEQKSLLEPKTDVKPGQQGALESTPADQAQIEQLVRENGIAKLTYVYSEDRVRSTVPAVLVAQKGSTCVITASTADLAPDAGVVRTFVTLSTGNHVDAPYHPTSTTRLFAYRASSVLTPVASRKSVPLAVGDVLSTVTVDVQEELRLTDKACRVMALDATQAINLPRVGRRWDFHDLTKLSAPLQEGTLILKDGRLAGVVLVGPRFLGADANHSFAVAVERVQQLADRLNYFAEIEADSQSLSRHLPSIVSISRINATTGQPEPNPNRRAGMVVDPRGYILTTRGTNETDRDVFHIRFTGENAVRAVFVADDAELGVTLLRLQSLKFDYDYDLVRLQDIHEPKDGDKIVVIHSPDQLSPKVGTVTETGRTLVINTETHKNLIQTDVSLALGEAGCLITTIEGTPVGMGYAIRAGKPPTSFAIPFAAVLPFLEKSLPPPPRSLFKAAFTSTDQRASLVDSLIKNPKLETFLKLLALADGVHPRVTELLDDWRRHSGKEKMGGEVKLIRNGQEQFAIVSAKVIPIIEPSDVAVRVDPERRAECAFVFDMQGRLIDTIGGKLSGGDSLGGDDIHVVNLGPEEDWFVRVMNFEKRGELNYRSDYYRIANPVVKSFRLYNLPNACSWSNGPEKIPRQGRLHPAHPKAERRFFAGIPKEVPVTTAAGVPTVSPIVWDGDRNRWVAAPSAFVKGLPLYEVDTTWSREFEPLEPQPGQLIVEGGIREYDHWHAWEAAVPEQGNAIVALTIPQRDGPAKVIEKKLAPGRHTVQLQAKPKDNGQGVQLKLWIDDDQKDDFDLPFVFGEAFANHPPIVHRLKPTESARLVHRLLKDTTAALLFEIKLQPTIGVEAAPNGNAAITLPEPLVITGKVEHADGTPAAGATVSALRFRPTVPAESRRKTVTNDKGEFTLSLSGIAGTTARWSLIALKNNDGGEYREGITVPAGDPASGNIVIRLRPGRTISGVVLEESTRRPVVNAQVFSHQGQAVQTNAQGRFELRGVPMGVERLAVKAAGLARTYVNVDVSEQSSTGIEILLSPGGTVRGRVLDQNDQPVADAAIEMPSSSGTIAVGMAAVSDADGRFVYDGIPLKTLQMPLGAHKPGYEDLSSEMFSIRDAQTPREMILHVRSKDGKPSTGGLRSMLGGNNTPAVGTIRGHVLDPNGNPVKQFSVDFLPVTQSPPQLLGGVGDRPRRFASTEGRFIVGRLDVDKNYRVAVIAPGFGQVDVEPIVARPAGNWTEQDEVVFRLVPAHSLKIRVIDAETKQPLPDVRIGLKVNARKQEVFEWNYVLVGARTEWTTADGIATFLNVPGSEAPVFIDHPGYSRSHLDWQAVARADAPMEIALQKESRLHVRLSNVTDLNPRGLYAEIQTAAKDRSPQTLANPNPPIAFDFQRLPNGKQTIAIHDGNSKTPWEPLITRKLDLQPGDNTLEIELPAKPADAQANAVPTAATSKPPGTLKGRFIYDGEAPKPRDMRPDLTKLDKDSAAPRDSEGRPIGTAMWYMDYLKAGIRPKTEDASLLVDKDGGVANVIVWVTSKDIPWAPKDYFQTPAKIFVKDGHFTPRVRLVTAGQPLVVENADPVPFTFATMFSRNSDVNALLPPAADKKPFRIDKLESEQRPAPFKSNVAIWANGFVFVRENDYVAVSQPDGTFTMPDLPPGEWEFRAWHERRGYLAHWPKGTFTQKIQSGDNGIGTIKLKPELFELATPN